MIYLSLNNDYAFSGRTKYVREGKLVGTFWINGFLFWLVSFTINSKKRRNLSISWGKTLDRKSLK
jgi:hypothetical protein